MPPVFLPGRRSAPAPGSGTRTPRRYREPTAGFPVYLREHISDSRRHRREQKPGLPVYLREHIDSHRRQERGISATATDTAANMSATAPANGAIRKPAARPPFDETAPAFIDRQPPRNRNRAAGFRPPVNQRGPIFPESAETGKAGGLDSCPAWMKR